ncbi:MAG: glycosidase [Candidatus Omnitrophota bacterium]
MVKEIFTRDEGNPILKPADWPYRVNSVFNPGAVEFNGETLLLVRVEDMKGFSHLAVAKSRDGRQNWRIDTEHLLRPDENIGEERFGLEDSRVVWLPERNEYAITYVSFSRGGPLVSLAFTKDFQNFQRQGPILPPEDKDASLFPKTFHDHYFLIHRPIIRGEAHIWICSSPDLKHWGHHQILLPARSGWWDCHRVGLGPPPLETPEGWLLIYHGIRMTAAGSIYRVGLALLDKDDPSRVIRRCDEWVFGPKLPYENSGDTPGVVFPTGVILDKDGKLRLYYGAADTSVCLATASLSDILACLKSC